ncbi:MAG: phosphoenolpyruvate carboxylase [Melioribacteraceae bacterium]
MKKKLKVNEFDKLVKNKFNIYNSLFLNLPFQKISNIGMLIPLLHHVSKEGLESAKDPLEILDLFFKIHTNIKSEKEKIDFMFRVIQYVERQVVLYDSVEDAAFDELQSLENNLSLKDYIHLLQSKKNGDKLLEQLSDFSVRIVFTAHPTQFYPPSVLDIISKLRLLIDKNDINKMDLTLQQLGLTSLINSKKPTPIDEARNIIYFLRNVYYDAIIELYSYVKKNIPNKDFDNTNIIQFGFWPGGDRDGNPFVTSEVTMNVADQLRTSLMKCYYREIKNLEKKLTFRELENVLSDLRNKIYVAMFDTKKILNFDEIINPLLTIRKTLINNYNSLYLEDLENFIDRVKIFRTHFATLDIRQNHSVHKKTIEEILKKEKLISNSLDELNKDELVSILINNKIDVSADDFEDEIVKDTIRTIAQIKDIQNKNGEEGCNRYIISNSEDIFSVLFVYGLLKWIMNEEEQIPIDIIPLFESMEAMTNSETIMKELFEISEYRNHINQRKETQTVMLGFSDGTKDGGYLQANWSIFKTKENLSAVCNQYNIKVIFFDGRGGPPARGGGKTHRFYASQSNSTANHAIQLTIQGQTITSKFGTKEHFIHNCEQLLTAGLSHNLFEKENYISDESREIIETLATLSFDKYTTLKNHKKFIPYLEKKSTLKYYSKANIGSRPSKRGNKKKLELKDLRAISFVGSWSQLKQNVPGYFGMGTAIQSLVNDGKLNELKKIFREVPFFKALILNSMMSLSKCYFELTAYIAKDQEFKNLWNILLKEYKLSKKMMLLISDYTILMEEEPTSRSSIEIREQIVLPLLVIQQYALQKIEKKSKLKNNYEKIVKRSLYGNINASRNSA